MIELPVFTHHTATVPRGIANLDLLRSALRDGANTLCTLFPATGGSAC